MVIHEVPGDALLPQLSTAFNPTTIQPYFEQGIFAETEARIRSCGIRHIKYRPSKNCMVYYHLQLQDSLQGRLGEQILCARLYPNGGSRSRFVKAQQQQLATPAFGKPLSHVPELDMIVWAFPNDRKLHSTSQLMSDEVLRHELLPPVIAENFGHEWRIHALQKNLVHYVPEHTCTVRVLLHLTQPHAQIQQLATLYAKTYSEQRGADTDESMRQLWQSQARESGHLHIAQSLGYQPSAQVLWQMGVPGETLLAYELDRERFPALLSQAAKSVAALHTTQIDWQSLTFNRSVTLDDWWQRLEKAASLLAQFRPQRQAQITQLIDRLLAQIAYLDQQPLATLHGDLHLQNFLVNEGQITLIDLDSLCHGSPWQDIGSFLAGLYYRSLITGTSMETTERAIETFYQAYIAQVPWPASRRMVGWYISVALVNERAFRSMTRMKRGNFEMIDNLIDLADQISLLA